MLMENDEKTREAVSSVLETEQYEVISVGSAFDGLSRLYQNCFDLVILSDDLPGANEGRLCSRLRQLCYVPIIVIGRKKPEATVEILDSGADIYLPKDSDYHNLVARIHSLLRRKNWPGGKPPGGQSGGGTGTTITRVNGGSGNLSITESRLVSCLALNDGGLVTHPQLLAEVWGEKRLNLNALKLYAYSLRKKLGNNGDRLFDLVNGRGIGFRLVPNGEC